MAEKLFLQSHGTDLKWVNWIFSIEIVLMPSDPAFSALMRRVRVGNAEAAADLVHRFEPNVRRVIRLRLTSTEEPAELAWTLSPKNLAPAPSLG